jgi:hypothetical protein
MNLANFLCKLPEHRKYQMRFEDLMSRPQEITAALCQRFGLPFHPDLLKPVQYDQANSAKASTADALRPPIFETDRLSAITWEMAEAFGYRRETARPIKNGDGNPLQISTHLHERKEFIDRQRQRRMVHRKHRLQGG